MSNISSKVPDKSSPSDEPPAWLVALDAERDAAFRRMRRAETQRRRRRKRGVIPRALYERRNAPWEYHGVCRRTWERWRKIARAEAIGREPDEEEIASWGTCRKCEAERVASVKPIYITNSEILSESEIGFQGKEGVSSLIGEARL